MKNLVFLFCVSFIFLSCDDIIKTTINVKFDKKAFYEQRQLWQDSNIKNYQYNFSNNMFFYSYNGILFIENGIFKYDLPDAEYHELENYKNYYTTIDEIYKTIEETYNMCNGSKHSKNDVYITEIIIEYDKINHIPNTIYYKEYVPPGLMIEGSLYYIISNFEKME